MTPTELYLAAIKGRTALITATEATLAALLRDAAAQIVALLSRQPTDYQQWYLPTLAAEIRGQLADLGKAAGADVSAGLADGWDAGEAMVDDAIRAAGLRIVLPRIDTMQLQAMRAFATEKIVGITLDAGNRINTELGRVVIGGQTPFDAVRAVSEILTEGGAKRAGVIVRTQLAQAHSAATQARMEAFTADVPNLQKKWIKSGKREPRLWHAVINGQVKPVNEPFVLRGGAVKMMAPHDPSAPPGEVINCGCISVPVVPGWGKQTPAEAEAADMRARLKAATGG